MPIQWRVVLAFVLAATMFVLLLGLGFWQLSRAEYKERLQTNSQQNLDQEELLLTETSLDGEHAQWFFRRSVVRGRFDDTHEFLLDNRTDAGRAGFHVLTPFEFGTHTVVVNRGWVALAATRQTMPDIRPVPDSEVTVHGMLTPPPRPGLILGDTGHGVGGDWPRIVQTADLTAMAHTLGTKLLPAILLLDSDNPACHVCEWNPVPGMGPSVHRGYAFQWFALAAALLFLCIHVIRRGQRHAR